MSLSVRLGHILILVTFRDRIPARTVKLDEIVVGERIRKIRTCRDLLPRVTVVQVPLAVATFNKSILQIANPEISGLDSPHPKSTHGVTLQRTQ